MADARITIEDLAGTALPTRDHVIPAMAGGLSVKLSVAQILARILVGDLPDGMLSADAAGRAKMADAFINNAKILDATIATAKLASATLTDLKWLSKAVGEFYIADDGVTGVDIPPSGTSGPSVWVELTSGLTGIGQFNSGKLTSESVSGSAPLVLATAVVSLSGSPMNGQTIRLLNTERRILRAGSAGAIEADADQAMTASITNLVTDGGNNTTAPLTKTSGVSANLDAGGGARVYATVTFDNTTAIRTANETRMKNIGVRVFRRIK